MRVDKASFIVGRGPSADLNLPEAGGAGEHAMIGGQAGGFVLEDGGSRNGTYVNGRRVKRVPLLCGNVITIGETDLTFSYGSRRRFRT